MTFAPSWASYQPQNTAGQQFFDPMTGQGGAIQGNEFGQKAPVPSGFSPLALPGSQLFNAITGQGGEIQGTNLSGYGVRSQPPPAASYAGLPGYQPQAPAGPAAKQSGAQQPTADPLEGTPIGRLIEFNPAAAKTMMSSPSFAYAFSQLMGGFAPAMTGG